ncbi:MAG: PilN domain-containing protein, partial [Gammaproteobacteria bacterium]|nr:PilN domain-containing protein [Gammaproteobacteria bacterium]
QKLNAKWTATYGTNKQQLTWQRFDQLKSRLATINQLTEMEGLDISLILSQLEGLMPDQFYLLSLNYRPIENDLSLVIESPDIAKIAGFIDKLETARLFADISIVRQTHVSSKGRTAVQFELHLKSGKVGGTV